MRSVKVPKKRSLDDDLKIYEAYRSYVRHEDRLVNNRISWMLTIHGFLYASYGLTLHKKLEFAEKLVGNAGPKATIELRASLSQYATKENFSNLLPVAIQIEAFLFVIAVVGIVISVSAKKIH